ncbi:hypothetical protein OHB07_16290 [Streptomyces sp. NBC_00111]|uniref:hypothetical protein n=1 Tax=Streptomyces sp. NBC_00111 TaxID=2975655 RepID=UPI00324F0BF2
MTDTTSADPAIWSDDDPLMQAIASTVYEQCGTDPVSSIVVDDPRNIAAVAATVARRILGTTEQPPAHPAPGMVTVRIPADQVPALLDDLPAWRDGWADVTKQVLRDVRAGGSVGQADTVVAPERVKHSGPATAFCVLCLSGEHERVTEAYPAQHRWRTETYDYLADEWDQGTPYTERADALARHQVRERRFPTWEDGTPVQRRIVRETTTYTVEQLAAEAQQPTPAPAEVVALCDLMFEDGRQCAKPDGHRPPGSDDPHVPAPAEAPPVCGDRSPAMGSLCQRSPGHTYPHRDAKQKGTESSSWWGPDGETQ